MLFIFYAIGELVLVEPLNQFTRIALDEERLRAGLYAGIIVRNNLAYC